MIRKIIIILKLLFGKISIPSTQIVPIKLIIVNDFNLLRRGLCNLLKSNHTILSECINGRDLIEKIEVNNLPDVVLMDIYMPGMDGFETTLWLKQNYPFVKVLVTGSNDDENTIQRMILNGAKGYISITADPYEFKTAIDAIVKKGFYYPRDQQMRSDLTLYNLTSPH